MSISKESILDDLENNRLPLPTLPEVAFKVRDKVEQEDASITEIAKLIETDATLAARIIQVGNSSLYRGMSPSNSVLAATGRMGLITTRNLVLCLVMKQLFQATHPVVDRLLRASWKLSTDVAALSAVIAKHYTQLEPDSALLAGLTHSIGMAPILVKAESDTKLLASEQALERILYALYPIVGTEILKSWGFSQALIEVPAQHLNLDRQNAKAACFTDIVQVALLQTVAGTKHPLGSANLANVAAIDRLNMREHMEEIELMGGVIEVEEIKAVIL